MSRPIRIAEVPPRFTLGVQSVIPLGDEVYRIRLDPHPLPWTPGDCVTLYAPEAPAGQPYSFSGPPDAAFSEFWIRKFPRGRVSRFVTECGEGDQIEVSPPFGWFRPLEPAGVPKIYIATGTGIAPFLSAMACPSDHEITVLWGTRVQLPLMAELSNAQVVCCVSRQRVPGTRHGRVTELLADLELPLNHHAYLCGLDVMIGEVSRFLRERGMPEDRIHTECFFTSSSSSSYAR